jgi:hypothetical protein
MSATASSNVHLASHAVWAQYFSSFRVCFNCIQPDYGLEIATGSKK